MSEYKRQSNDRDKVFSERMDNVRDVKKEKENLNFNLNSDNLNLQDKDPWTKSKEDSSQDDPEPEENSSVTEVVESVNETSASDVVETVQ